MPILDKLRKGDPVSRLITSLSTKPSKGLEALREYFKFVEYLENNYGEKQTIKVLKDVNSKARHMVVGYPSNENSFGGIWFKISKTSGLPKKLGKTESFLNFEPRVALAITNQVYTLTCEPKVDVDSIVRPYKGKTKESVSSDFKKEITGHVPKLNPIIPKGFLLTCKGGPNGPSAISQAQDMVAILLTYGEQRFSKMIESIYGPNSWFEDEFNKFAKTVITTELPIKFKGVPRMSRIISIPGPAGKSRTVFVANFWIQQLLLPLHDSLMNHFREIGNDGTWDQNESVKRICTYTSSGYLARSYDLKEATDRWPAYHQKIALEEAFGEEISNIWFEIVTTSAPSIEYSDRYVKYEVGQPMGLFSSWAAFNFTHHHTVRMIHRRLSKPYKYELLGDDNVIADPDVGSEYEKYLHDLGVDFNMSKSVISEKGKPCSAEFARNLIRDGNIVGTISPGLLTKVFSDKQFYMFIEIVREYCDKFREPVIVTPAVTLLPVGLHKLLSTLPKKIQDNLVVMLSLNTQEIKLPREIRENEDAWGVEYLKSQGYIAYDNPWSNLDERGVTSLIKNRWLAEAQANLKVMETFWDSLREVGTTPRGYLLESTDHPLRTFTVQVNEELMRRFWHVMSGYKGYIPDAPTLLDKDVTLLEAMLCKGLTYRQWRDTKEIKIKILSSFIVSCYKTAQPKPEKVQEAVWQPTDYESLWESQS